MNQQVGEPAEAATIVSDNPADEGSANLETQHPEEGVQPSEGQHSAEGADGSNDEGEKGKKSKGGFQQRIDRLTREKYEAMRRAQALEQRLAELERQVQPDSKINIPEDGLPPMPTPEQFGYDEEAYTAAMKEWADARAAKAQEVALQQIEQQRLQQEALRQQAELAQKVQAAQEKYPDFVEKVMDPSLPSLQEVNPAAFEAVLSSDKMADVAYYLANNPQEVFDLAGVPPVEAVKRIAYIEAKFSGKGGAAPAAAQQTAPPPKTVSGSAQPATDLDKVSDIDEWMRKRWEQLSN